MPSHGERHYRATLSEDTVRAIKLSLADGTPQAALARRHNTTKVAINHIARGRTWTHVPWPSGFDTSRLVGNRT